MDTLAEELPEYEFTFDKNRITVSALFALVHIIEQMQSSSFHTFNEDGTELILVEKPIIKIELDYKGLETKIINWHFSKEESLTLDPAESKLFKDLWFLMLGYLRELEYDSGCNLHAVTLFTNSLFKCLVNIHSHRFEDVKDDNYDFGLN